MSITIRGRELLRQLQETDSDQIVQAVILNLLQNGSDWDCYKINVFRLAQEFEVSKTEALRTFLFATKLGIFDLNWDIYCPSCMGLPEYYSHIMGLKNRAHCSLCTFDWDLDLAEQVEVTFTVNPNVRTIDYVDFKDRDFEGMMEYLDENLGREGRAFTAADCFFPDRVVDIEGEFVEGHYRLWVPEHANFAKDLIIGSKVSTETQIVEVVISKDGEPQLDTLHLAEGTIVFRVSGPDYPDFNGFLVYPVGPLTNWVSAAYVACQQDFRDLFEAEFLSPESAFSIKNIALMFTDIKSSTELYEQVGDSKAYSLVQRHFEIMKEIIRDCEGGIVKTIGDAVMAAFPLDQKAIEACHQIQQEFRKQKEELGGLEIKIGLHRGSVIAVSNNKSNDFFGGSVNTAARIQGKADAGEVVISQTMMEDLGVREYIENTGLQVKEFRAELKGLQDCFLLYSF
jgi:adenylate cyclase